MSMIGLFLKNENVGSENIKIIARLLSSSGVAIKKLIVSGEVLIAVDMLKNSHNDEIKKLMSVMDYFDKENLSYELYKADKMSVDELKIAGVKIVRAQFDKILNRSREIEIQTQELVDSELRND